MGLRDQNNGKKIGISGPRIYHVTTLLMGGYMLLVKDVGNGLLATGCVVLA